MKKRYLLVQWQFFFYETKQDEHFQFVFGAGMGNIFVKCRKFRCVNTFVRRKSISIYINKGSLEFCKYPHLIMSKNTDLN